MLYILIFTFLNFLILLSWVYSFCCCLVNQVVSNTFVTQWNVACHAPLSMGFPKQEFWSGLPFPSPGDLPDPGIEPTSHALAGGFFPTEPLGKPHILSNDTLFLNKSMFFIYISSPSPPHTCTYYKHIISKKYHPWSSASKYEMTCFPFSEADGHQNPEQHRPDCEQSQKQPQRKAGSKPALSASLQQA